jgi:hypothetical protein
LKGSTFVSVGMLGYPRYKSRLNPERVKCKAQQKSTVNAFASLAGACRNLIRSNLVLNSGNFDFAVEAPAFLS